MTALIQALLDPRCYPHPVDEVRLIETHISWLLLTGRYAYKIKKPVDLGFADFRTLAQRRHCCHEEVRLNGRYASQIYLGVVPIAGSVTQPRISGAGTAIEYAVQMREFDQQDLLLTRLQAGRLDPAHIDALADVCAAFHDRADVAPAASQFGSPAWVLEDALANFDPIERAITGAALKTRLSGLRRWTVATHERLAPIFARRRSDRRIRECHGDLHLGNIVLVADRVTMFDCIEFNERFRWIDVMNELAFAVMDLAARDRPDYAHRLLNRYLQSSGDYEGLDVLPFYLVYRAMVRAKVDCIHAGQRDVGAAVRRRERQDFDRRIALAQTFARPSAPFIAIMCGVSGSGKTHLSELALERTGAIRLRSDIERKRLSGLAADQMSASELDSGIYGPRTSDLTFDRLAAIARSVLAAGYSVIVDATFILRARRAAFAALAAELKVPFVVLHCRAADRVVEARVARRHAARADASEADLRVLAHQRQLVEPPAAAEADIVIEVETENDASVATALERLSAIGARTR